MREQMNLRESKTSGTEVIAFDIASDGVVALHFAFHALPFTCNMFHRCFCCCAPMLEFGEL